MIISRMRLGQLFSDLALDQVLSLGQVRRRYLPAAELSGVHATIMRLVVAGRLVAWPEWVPLTARARRLRAVIFVAPMLVHEAPAALRHLCGVAEMRWCLRDVVRAWDATGATVLGETEHPDALAEDASGYVAVEYDAGSYSAQQVRKKAQTYLAVYGRQVWGVPHRARAGWIRSHLPPGTEVLLAPWW